MHELFVQSGAVACVLKRIFVRLNGVAGLKRCDASAQVFDNFQGSSMATDQAACANVDDQTQPAGF